nr:amidase family protein [bacterium]
MKIHEMTASRIAAGVRAGEFSAREAALDALKRIGEVDGTVRAFLRLDPEGALAAADRIDERVASGEDPGPLAGVPVGLKDNLCVEGREVTCGSAILAGYAAPYDATVVARLRASGAVFLGQLNMDEFAMGSSNENSSYGPVRNPWDPCRVPGGSSGGAAAAVASRQCALALGSDTGGSIRQPASLCGVAGLKPTYGRVSRYGLIAYASSLDQIGPFARSVEDVALALEVMAGPDPRDSTSAPLPVPSCRREPPPTLEGMRLGVPAECFSEGMSAEVEERFREACAVYRDAGAELVEIRLPRLPDSVACYYIISTAEASSNLARFDGVQYGIRSGAGEGMIEMYQQTRAQGFGPEV